LPPHAGTADADRAPSLAVLAAGGLGAAAGAAVALGVVRRLGVPAGLVLHWRASGDVPPHGGDGALAVPAARRIAAAATREGLVARGRGRLVVADMPRDARAAVRAATAVLAVVPAPAVLVVEGPRPAVFDELLTAHDGLLVLPGAAGGEALAHAAVEAAAAMGPPAVLLDLPAGPLATVPAGGLLLPPPVRRAVDRALRSLA
jgi:hypothetical protein